MHPPKKSLLAALATVSSMTLVSRILGFVRDAVIARAFGAGIATDAFFVAFRIPNLLRRLFAEGAFAQAFVPVLSEYRTQRGEDDTRLLVDRIRPRRRLRRPVLLRLGGDQRVVRRHGGQHRVRAGRHRGGL